MLPFDPSLDALIDLAFAEDLGSAGDVTSLACVPPSTRAEARVVAKQDGVIAGLGPFVRVFGRFDEDVSVRPRVTDGDRVRSGDVVITVSGYARSLLIGERTALNFLQRLSGVATKTAQMVSALKGHPQVRLVDTRKTTPGWRALEKAAVRAGGGHNHRAGLYDAVMIKENHIVASGGITEAVKRARLQSHHLMGIEVETTNLDEVKEALAAGADTIMLDNFDNERTAEAVSVIHEHSQRTGRPVVIEASGNMTLARLPAVAALGVDVISVGGLTHSAPALDLSLLLELRVGEDGAWSESGAPRSAHPTQVD
jgi:nicotinate-nucleotide pyrophosphorylase (carboxylating)